MTFTDIQAVLEARFGAIFQANLQNPQPFLIIPTERLVEVCQFLRDDEHLYFDLLACVTAIDNGEAGTIEVVYNLTSIPYEHNLMLKVFVQRNQEGEPLPSVPSVTSIWRTADWHEREAYDLVGIRFDGHPDLRRILLPTDWVGHPLRTDYKDVDEYHGIKNQ